MRLLEREAASGHTRAVVHLEVVDATLLCIKPDGADDWRPAQIHFAGDDAHTLGVVSSRPVISAALAALLDHGQVAA